MSVIYGWVLDELLSSPLSGRIVDVGAGREIHIASARSTRHGFVV